MAHKQHSIQKLELSETDKSAKTAEARRKDRAVTVTKPYSTSSAKDTPESRRADHFRANGHTESKEANGLAAAKEDNLSRTPNHVHEEKPKQSTGLETAGKAAQKDQDCDLGTK